MKKKLPPTVAALAPAPYNPRSISEERLGNLGRAMRKFGDLGGIVFNVRTGNLVGGHQRVKSLDPAWKIVASKRDGTGGTVSRGYIVTPFGELDYREVDWDEKTEKAANVAANAHGGDFDPPKLDALLVDLRLAGADLSILGLDHGITDPEAAAPADDGPRGSGASLRAAPGELWHLGKHRLLCGDATDSAQVRHLMGGGLADMVFTDPPYGVSYEAASGDFEVIEGDRKRDDALLALLTRAFKNACKATVPRAAFYVWHASATRQEFADALRSAGLIEKQYLIWAKPSITLGRADYHWAHEPCFYAAKAGQTTAFHGDRTQATVWRVAVSTSKDLYAVVGPGLVLRDGSGGEIYIQGRAPKAKKPRSMRLAEGAKAHLATAEESGSTDLWEVQRERDYAHPTQKPVELARRALANSSLPGQRVLDLFGGSGSTIIAAEQMGREACVMELDPAYCTAIINRWEKFTGKKAVKA